MAAAAAALLAHLLAAAAATSAAAAATAAAAPVAELARAVRAAAHLDERRLDLARLLVPKKQLVARERRARAAALGAADKLALAGRDLGLGAPAQADAALRVAREVGDRELAEQAVVVAPREARLPRRRGVVLGAPDEAVALAQHVGVAAHCVRESRCRACCGVALSGCTSVAIIVVVHREVLQQALVALEGGQAGEVAAKVVARRGGVKRAAPLGAKRRHDVPICLYACTPALCRP